MRTVFILGAGASKEVGLPLGRDLARFIADRLDFRRGSSNGSQTILEALRYSVIPDDPKNNTWDLMVRTALDIRDALPLAPSIDNLVHSRRPDKAVELIAKLGIAETILAEERKCDLYFEPNRRDSKMDLAKIEATWFIAFYRRLGEYGTLEDLKVRLERMTFIVFNYDRCLEHFLYHAFRTYYRLSDEDTLQLMQSIRIFHPYGSVGELPWTRSPSAVGFGEQIDAQTLLSISRGVRTFTEGTDVIHSDIQVVRERLYEADQIVFLGFHFHQLNVELLFPPRAKVPSQNHGVATFATALGFKDNDRAAIANDIKARFEDPVRPVLIEEWTCAGLFANNQRTLRL